MNVICAIARNKSMGHEVLDAERISFCVVFVHSHLLSAYPSVIMTNSLMRSKLAYMSKSSCTRVSELLEDEVIKEIIQGIV